jgi:iron complex outermembrane receptor protein
MPISVRAAMRSSRLSVAVLAVLFPFASAVAADAFEADTQTRTLEKIEVIGEAVRPSAVEDLEQARARLDLRAGGTGVVDGESYRGGRVSTLADALGYAAGVFIQPRFGAEEARLSIRGSGIQRTFHGRGIDLLQDGSPLNLADGGVDFQAAEPLSARHIEVYRGANALEYGAATLGGAINFVSPSGYGAAPVGVRLEAGSFGYTRSQISLAGVSGRADGYLSATGFVQDGFRDHAKQETYRLFGNAGFRFGEALDGRVYFTHVGTHSELPGNLTLAQSLDNPELASPGNIALDQRRDFTLDRVAGKLAWTPAEGRSLVLSAFYSDKSLHHPIFQVLNQDTQDYGMDLRWRGESILAGRRNILTAGITLAQGNVEDDRFVNVAGSEGARTNRLEQRARNVKAYLENQLWLGEQWALSLGAQALESERRSRDEFITGGRDESFDVDYSGFSPKLGLLYRIDPQTQVFGNLSRSLEPPSFGEITGGTGVTPVDEQRATTMEIGFRTQRGNLSVDLAMYRARVEDELLALSDRAGNPLGTVNAKRTVHQGVEFGLGWRFAPALTLSANYLWNDFKFDNDPVYGDNDLAGMPPQQLRAKMRWQPGERFYFAPNLEWVPSGYYVDHANTFRAPGYTLIGLKIGGRIGDRWSWFADARNLQDRKWIATTSVVADARGLDGANFLPGDGRSIYAGIEWKLK